ncbi:MAG: hypothetical protein F4138_04220 [Acidimicrobiia bacterium]|nr:hypothetical protein [Acidimicrobiia bacterium]MYC58425.1 hypothetical protein [Acidimicrobiia bacterium]MYG94184.1 hypothetical protein [Acidimicrobiia bacterium]MYI30469.1 hypothetical protein [Acidimicrobiia bacterium]
MNTEPSFSERFADGTSSLIHQNQQVRPMLLLAVNHHSKIRVQRIAARSDRRQALKLAASNGTLELAGASAEIVSLWADTSPKTVELLVNGPRVRWLEVWNAWDIGGLETAWLGNSGIITESAEQHLTLHCSDGLDDPSFSDLQVAISVSNQ